MTNLTLKILRCVPQDLESVFGHFSTWMKGLSI